MAREAFGLFTSRLSTGDDHRRHKRLMSSGFGAPEARSLVPLFLSYANMVRIRAFTSVASSMLQYNYQGHCEMEEHLDRRRVGRL